MGSDGTARRSQRNRADGEGRVPQAVDTQSAVSNRASATAQ